MRVSNLFNGIALLMLGTEDAIAFASEAGTRSADEKHAVRAYNACAYVTILGIPVFSRCGVGGGFASLDQAGSGRSQTIRLRFLSGSTPEKAHGLNRTGFIEERIRERDGSPSEIDYFGFITANRETSVAQARAALKTSNSEQVPYVAARSSMRGTIIRYPLCNRLLPARYRWTDSAELLQQVVSKFQSKAVPEIEITTQPAGSGSAETFLYALVRAIGSGKAESDTRFVYNGRFYQLSAEQIADEGTGEDFRQSARRSFEHEAAPERHALVSQAPGRPVIGRHDRRAHSVR